MFLLLGKSEEKFVASDLAQVSWTKLNNYLLSICKKESLDGVIDCNSTWLSLKISKYRISPLQTFAKSACAVEYTDCFATEE